MSIFFLSVLFILNSGWYFFSYCDKLIYSQIQCMEGVAWVINNLIELDKYFRLKAEDAKNKKIVL